MWAFDFASQTWAQVQQSAPWPTVRGWPASAVIGSSLYFFGGDGVSNDLWRWSPGAPSGGPAPQPEAAVTVLGAAAGAGIAFASLSSLAALVLTALLYRRLTPGTRGPSAAAMGSVYEGL